MKLGKQLLKACLPCTLVLFAATQVYADALLRHVHTGNFTFPQGANVLVPITAANAVQSDVFNTSGKIQVTYEAECAVSAAAGNTTTWLNIDILLINLNTGAVTTLAPTVGTTDALCTSNGTAGADGWTRCSVTGFASNLPVANYVVRIQASVQNGAAGTSGWLGDTALIIWK